MGTYSRPLKAGICYCAKCRIVTLPLEFVVGLVGRPTLVLVEPDEEVADVGFGDIEDIHQRRQIDRLLAVFDSVDVSLGAVKNSREVILRKTRSESSRPQHLTQNNVLDPVIR